jgi:hypothetical protein
VTDIEALVARGPEAVTEWLDAIASGATAAPTEYNHWLQAFIVIEYALTDEIEQRGTFSWAPVVVRLHEAAAVHQAGRERADALLRIAMVRVRLIIQFGAQPGHPILDPQHVFRWVEENLPPLTDAVRARVGRIDIPVAELAELRRVRNCLYPVALLLEKHTVEGFPRILDWLTVRDRLI